MSLHILGLGCSLASTELDNNFLHKEVGLERGPDWVASRLGINRRFSVLSREYLVKTKNRFYDMRGTLDQLQFDVIKYEPHVVDNRESKVYLGKRLTSDVLRSHTSRRTVTYV